MVTVHYSIICTNGISQIPTSSESIESERLSMMADAWVGGLLAADTQDVSETERHVTFTWVDRPTMEAFAQEHEAKLSALLADLQSRVELAGGTLTRTETDS